jgi:hypothetical protein
MVKQATAVKLHSAVFWYKHYKAYGRCKKKGVYDETYDCHRSFKRPW